MHQLNAGNDNGGIPEPFEAKHNVDPRLDVPMVLLDQIVQIFRGSNLRVAGQQAINLHLAHRAVGRRVAVQGNDLRGTALAFDRLLEESRGRSDISPRTEPEINSLA